MEQLEKQAEVAAAESRAEEAAAAVAAEPEVIIANPEEIAIDEEVRLAACGAGRGLTRVFCAQVEDVAQQNIPKAVFGQVLERPVGALDRFKQSAQL